MKRIGALILTMLMLIATLPYIAFAQSDAIDELNLFGIVPKSINKSNLSEDATREELAYLASRIVSSDAKAPKETRFSDVTAENQYSGYIEYMAGMGIINGKGDGIYDPLGHVKPEMAAKVLINLLGYESFAQFGGGYPAGYMNLATDLGITKYLIAGDNGNLTKGALLDAVRFVLVTGFNEPVFITAGEETKVQLSDNKSSLLGSTLRVSVYTGTIETVRADKNSVTMNVLKNKYDTNYELLEAGLYNFDLAKGIDAFEYEFLPVTAWVSEDGEILKLSPNRNVEVKYGYVDSVNGKLSDDQNPVSNMKVITLLDDETEYDVADNAKMRFNNQMTTANVSLIGKFAKFIVVDGEVTFIESWDMQEGGLLTAVSEESLVYIKGTQKSVTLKEYDKFKIKRVFINNKPSDSSFIKEKTVFDYFADGDTIVIVNSEKQIVDTFYAKGSGGLEIGNSIYKANKTVYYSEDGIAYKADNYKPFLGIDVTAYIAPSGDVRYVAPSEGTAFSSNKIYIALKGYDSDVFGEEIKIECWALENGKLDKKMYTITNKTTFGEGTSKEDFLLKARVIDDTNLFVIEANGEGVVKSVELPQGYSGFLGASKGTTSHIVDSYIARLDIGRYLFFNKTTTPILALYEKDGVFSAKMLTWEDNLRGRGDLSSPLNVAAYGDETKASSPSLILITGDITALSTSTKSKFGVVAGKTIGIKEDGTECVNLQVFEGGTKPAEYSVSHEVADTIPSYALISYVSYNYAEGEQGSSDEIKLKEIKSGGKTLSAIDLSMNFSLWPEELSLSSAGFHKGTVENIDSMRMLTTNDYAAYVDQLSSGLLCVKYNPNNADKHFEGIEITDISYGDEVYYYADSNGMLRCVIKLS